MTAVPKSNQEWSRLAATDPLHAIASDKGRLSRQLAGDCARVIGVDAAERMVVTAHVFSGTKE